MAEGRNIYADAGDPGLSFILPSLNQDEGGITRNSEEGHFGAIVGRGGSGKTVLALQIVTGLLNKADEFDAKMAHVAGKVHQPNSNHTHAAFYFSLEAHPKELKRQVEQFSWGYKRYFTHWDKKTAGSRAMGDGEYSNGLYLVSVPPPAESLNTLILKIRQTIAGELRRIKSPVAVVIDPMGAINAGDELRTSLVQLKELADMHRTFVFLLTEKFAFDRYTSIEHYSQSILHLEHDPGEQQHRRMYVQKARGQSFRSGYHYFELQRPQNPGSLSEGIRIFPSVDAQSAHAHERLKDLQRKHSTPGENEVAFLPDGKDHAFLGKEQIEAGSAVFLMGPPGTFKEHVAGEFARADGDGATIYISFKADMDAVQRVMQKERRRELRTKSQKGDGNNPKLEAAIEKKEAISIDSPDAREKALVATTYFYDARSPLLTPEEILFTVRKFISIHSLSDEDKRRPGSVKLQRAVIWGLRRLYDFPNFKDDIVRFLEALVTMLKSEQITTLVVDWPDKTSASTVPIVDLCQYIFLTRVCHTAESLEDRNEGQQRLLERLWSDKPRQVALLRAQRTKHGVHHSQGVVFKQRKDQQGTIEQLTVEKAIGEKGRDFENLWINAGMKWEADLSLLS
jgi:KaiC/GvpD/RAD55 family RecA-like ATPase